MFTISVVILFQFREETYYGERGQQTYYLLSLSRQAFGCSQSIIKHRENRISLLTDIVTLQKDVQDGCSDYICF